MQHKNLEKNIKNYYETVKHIKERQKILKTLREGKKTLETDILNYMVLNNLEEYTYENNTIMVHKILKPKKKQ